jgi:hypothetical protein
MNNILHIFWILCIIFISAGHLLHAQTGCWLEPPPEMDPENTLEVVNMCPEDPGFPSKADMAGKDVKIVLPKDRACHKMMTIGGETDNPVHNVWIVGGKLEWNGPQEDSPGGAITMRYFDGTAFIEGIEIDVHNAFMDGVRCYHVMGPHARVIIQNSYIRGMGYKREGTHGDMFHAQGGQRNHLNELVMQNARGDLTNQGIFVPYRKTSFHGVRRMELDHVELHLDPRYRHGKISTMIFSGPYSNTDDDYPPDGQSYNEVYLNWWDPHYPYTTERKNITVPNIDYYDENGCAVFPDHAIKEGKITGTWCKGNPPNSPFVPVDKIGLNYDRLYFDNCHGVINAAICQSQTKPIIDGIPDTSWNFILADTLKRKTLGKPSSDADLSATFKSRWDNESFYLLVDVTDDSLMHDSGDRPWDDDAIEVFIDGNNDKATSYDADDHRYIFGWGNDTVYAYQDSAQPVNPEGITFARDNTAKGYRMEIKLNWTSIGVTPTEDQLAGFNIMVNDDDSGGSRDKQMAWVSKTDSMVQKPSDFGIVLLEGHVCGAAKVIKDPEKTIVEAQADAEFFIQSIHADHYQWQVNQGNDFIDLANDTTYSGVHKDTLHISNTIYAMLGYQYRCIVSNAIGTDTSKAAELIINDDEKPLILSGHDNQRMETGTECQYTLPDYTVDVVATDNHDDDLEITQDPAPGTVVSRSLVEVVLKAIDDFENTATKTFVVQAVDHTPPVITSVHPDQILEAGSGCQAILPDYTSFLSANDNCYRLNNMEITQDPAPYTGISDKANEVVMTVTDPEGNSSQISFKVDVVDRSKPLIQCPEDQNIELKQGQTAYAVSGHEFDPVTVDDNCSVDSIINDFNGSSTLAGAEFPVDATTIVWTATDKAGNKRQCSFDMVIKAPTSLESPAQSGINIYPNPTGGMLHYESNNIPIQKIKLLDLTGNKIIELKDTDAKGTIDITHLTSGIYFIQLSTKDGSWTRKIIKE